MILLHQLDYLSYWRIALKEPFFISKTLKQQVIINESSSCYKVAKFWWHAEEKRCILDRKERRLMCHILMINGRRRLHTSNVVIKQQSKATQNLSKFSPFSFLHTLVIDIISDLIIKTRPRVFLIVWIQLHVATWKDYFSILFNNY